MADSAVLEFSGHQYQRIDGTFTWAEAKTKCETLGAHLATVTSSEENNFIINNIRASSGNYRGWLGGTDAAREGTWVWITGEPWSFTDWGRYNGGNEPNNGRGGDYEHYLHYHDSYEYYSGTWNDGLNTLLQPAICEWEPVTATCDTTTPYNQGYTAGETAAKTACQSNPASCGITTTSTTPTGTTGSTTGHASYDPLAGIVRIPYVDVPNVFGAPFVYSVDLNIINSNPLQFQLKNATQVQ